MLLITVATENEKKPLEKFLNAADQVEVLVTGMGPVITAARLSSYLARHGAKIDGVMNIGVTGAYVDSGLTILDICLAQQEVFGDFGICMEDRIQDFDPILISVPFSFGFDNRFISWVADILNRHNINFRAVNFVTVSCVSGTRKRGDFLRKKFDAGCENMEGAAVAMVCNDFGLACVELRCVSNMVQDRDVFTWKLAEACDMICRATGAVLQAYNENGLPFSAIPRK